MNKGKLTKLKKIAKQIAEQIEKYGPQLSVTQRIKGVKQTWGGYLKQVDFEEIPLGEGLKGLEELRENENVMLP